MAGVRGGLGRSDRWNSLFGGTCGEGGRLWLDSVVG